MKYIYIIFFFLFFLSSCVVQEPSVTYEKTNAVLIQKSIKDLNSLTAVSPFISKNDNIAIVGVEDYDGGDYSLLATLEDEIIKEFVLAGYRVLERDHDMLYRLFSEDSNNFKYVNKIKLFDREYAHQMSGAKIFGNSSSGINDNSFLSGSAYNLSQASRSAEENYNQEYQSSLQSADKIISYRVIESGIVYNYEEKAGIGEVKREARTILEVRLTDTKTSEILFAQTLDGKAEDFVKEQHINALKDFSYKYYSRTLPKTHGNPIKATVTGGEKKASRWVYVIAAIPLFIILLSIG